jgi:hypothetical protein
VFDWLVFVGIKFGRFHDEVTMDYEPKSIDEQIDCLARLTGAPDSFVAQVRQLFTRKGISLEEDATPYVRALEEAFVREESIRAGARERGAQEANPLGQSASSLAKSYLQQMKRLRRLQSGSDAPPAAASGDDGWASAAGQSVVMQPQRDDLPMVPGPDDVQ